MKKISTIEPTKDVKNILRLINLIPPQIDLPDVGKIFNHLYSKKIEELENADPPIKFEINAENEVECNYHWSLTIDAVDDVLKKIDGLGINSLDLFSKILVLVSIIEKQKYNWNSAYDLKHCYSQFWEARIKVRHIAEFSLLFRENGYEIFRDNWYSFRTSNSVTLSSVPNVTPDGCFTFQTDLVARAFEGIKVERLKICEYCNQIFWASRLDKSGCSIKCGQNIRTRKRRDKVKSRSKSRIKAEKVITEDEKLDAYIEQLRKHSYHNF